MFACAVVLLIQLELLVCLASAKRCIVCAVRMGGFVALSQLAPPHMRWYPLECAEYRCRSRAKQLQFHQRRESIVRLLSIFFALISTLYVEMCGDSGSLLPPYRLVFIVTTRLPIPDRRFARLTIKPSSGLDGD